MNYRGKYVRIRFEDGKWKGEVFDSSGILYQLDSGGHYFISPVSFGKETIVCRYGDDDISLFSKSIATEDIITFSGEGFNMNNVKINKHGVKLFAIDFDKGIAFSVVKSR